MRTVFVDTLYWVAMINPRDQWHLRVVAVSRSLGNTRLVTTDEVLTESLTFLAGLGPEMRRIGAGIIRDILNDPNIEVVEQTRDTFLAGLQLYATRLDKQYSLTDCISMQTMRRHGLTEVLTHDRHFTQEAFVVLIHD